MNKKTKTIYSLAAIAILLVLLYLLEANRFQYGMLYSLLQKSVILSVVAVSMNLLNGFTGLFSLGQAGFMSIGAYITALLTIPVANLGGVYYTGSVHPAILSLRTAMEAAPEWVQGIYPFLALILGGLGAALLAALVGLPVLRLKSDYLAIATLGFSEIVRAIMSSPQMDSITNGSYGLNKIPTFPEMFGGLIPPLITPFLIAGVCILLMVLLINSTYGRAFKAIREDEIAAEAMGVSLFKHKQMAFIISSFFTGIGGGLFAMYMRSIEAKTFSIALTYDILLIIVIGGIGSVTGSVIGAFLVTISKEGLLRFFDEPLIIAGWEVPLFRTGFRMVIFSLLLMIVVLFYRQGLMGTREFSWEAVTRFPGWVKSKFSRKRAVGGGQK